MICNGTNKIKQKEDQYVSQRMVFVCFFEKELHLLKVSYFRVTGGSGGGGGKRVVSQWQVVEKW